MVLKELRFKESWLSGTLQKHLQYLIKWRSFGLIEYSRENAGNIHATRLIKAFHSCTSRKYQPWGIQGAPERGKAMLHYSLDSFDLHYLQDFQSSQ